MKLLNIAAGFTKSKEDLKSIYKTFIRSVLGQSAVVWHSSLKQKNRNDFQAEDKLDFTSALKCNCGLGEAINQTK